MFESNKSHEYDDHCFCMDCCSSPERVSHIVEDAEKHHHTAREYVEDHVPQLSLLIVGACVFLLFV
jgi:hypothetical protein